MSLTKKQAGITTKSISVIFGIIGRPDVGVEVAFGVYELLTA